MTKTKQQFKRETTKDQMIKTMQDQQKVIVRLQYELYMRDLLYNPCHEANRMSGND